jgi:hypothetical protein
VSDREAEEPEEDDEPQIVFKHGAQRLTFTARFDYVVTDAEALQAEAERLYRGSASEAGDADVIEHTGDPNSALHTILTERMGLSINGVTSAGAEWAVDEPEQTLWEEWGEARMDDQPHH